MLCYSSDNYIRTEIIRDYKYQLVNYPHHIMVAVYIRDGYNIDINSIRSNSLPDKRRPRIGFIT